MNKKPLVLIVLDGWGHNESPVANAIYAANSPVWDRLWQNQPRTLISGSGMDVGLPDGQMGNSEVGHMTIGAGRVVYQNFTRINKAIADGDFFTNPAYTNAVDKAVANDGAVHIMGLASPGGVHSHEDHLVAAIELAAKRGARKIFLHAFLDGRDTPPRSAKGTLEKLDAAFASVGVGRIASIVGRYFVMDRDNRWERVQPTYDLLTSGTSEFQANSAVEGLEQAYAREENDEFVKPTRIQADGQPDASMRDGDVVLFMNFRPDRAREITRAIVDGDDHFHGFVRKVRPQLADFVMTTEYADNIKASVAYPPQTLVNSLGEYLSNLNKTQLRIAETEKYAHVTFFFSGGQESLYPGEDRILVPSPQVSTYDMKPEMSAYEVTDKLVEAIESGKFDAIICNFANGDMVGHTGIFDAAVKAVEAVDICLGRICESLEEVGGECLITADHGNVELMEDVVSGQVLTAHTTEPVPFIYIGPRKVTMLDGGSLADVAPSMLTLLGIPQPAEMTGRSLVKLN